MSAKIPADTIEKVVSSLVDAAATLPEGGDSATREAHFRDKMDAVLAAEEAYESWKYNAQYLYTYIYSQVLEWPSLVIEWLPEATSVREHINKQQLAIGTHTSDGAQNYVILLDVLVPGSAALSDNKVYHKRKGGVEGMWFRDENDETFVGKTRVAARIPHPGEPNVVRHMPKRPHLLACIGTSGDVHIFDAADEKFADDTLPPLDGEVQHDRVVNKPNKNSGDDTEVHFVSQLKGLEGEGWGLAWSQHEGYQNYIAGVCEAGSLAIWDWDGNAPSSICEPLHLHANAHKAPQDVAWSTQANEPMLGTVGDDGILALWDLRQQSSAATVAASVDPLNSLSFNAYMPFLVVVGGVAKTLSLFDSRNLSSPVHTMGSHDKTINRVAFSHASQNIIASCGDDKRVKLWDMSRIGAEQNKADDEDGPPELIFGHAGHTESVTDVSWNPRQEYPWTIATVGEDNRLQIWQPSDICISAHEEDPLEDEVDAFVE